MRGPHVRSEDGSEAAGVAATTLGRPQGCRCNAKPALAGALGPQERLGKPPRWFRLYHQRIPADTKVYTVLIQAGMFWLRGPVFGGSLQNK